MSTQILAPCVCVHSIIYEKKPRGGGTIVRNTNQLAPLLTPTHTRGMCEHLLYARCYGQKGDMRN